MHELRRGELARAGEVPHAPYYGSIDATPLWLVLLGETWRWLGDRALVDGADAERRARARLDRAAADARQRLGALPAHARQGPGEPGLEGLARRRLVPRRRRSRQPPIALVEVQGYVVGALDAMAMLLRVVGNGAARRSAGGAGGGAAVAAARGLLGARDRLLRARARRQGAAGADHHVEPGASAVHRRGAEGSRVAAGRRADGRRACGTAGACARWRAGRRCSIRSRITTDRCGRTTTRCSRSARRGTIGRDAALRVLEGLYEASRHFRRGRLPELFCGLGRGEGDFLVHYPVSCSPQAWASGAFFLLLQACLGLRADAPGTALSICDPQLPMFMRHDRSRGRARRKLARVAAFRPSRRAHALRCAQRRRRSAARHRRGLTHSSPAPRARSRSALPGTGTGTAPGTGIR